MTKSGEGMTNLNGDVLFREGKWVLRARADNKSMILHECIRPSNHATLSTVYHPPIYDPKSVMLWQCTMCKKTATNDIRTVWMLMNSEKLNCEDQARVE